MTAFIGIPCLLMVVGLEEVMDISSSFMITFALTLHRETINLDGHVTLMAPRTPVINKTS